MPNINCKCDSNFTCGYCLRNAKPYFFTPSTFAEQSAERMRAYKAQQASELHECPVCERKVAVEPDTICGDCFGGGARATVNLADSALVYSDTPLVENHFQ